jgi:hypothetical protein
MKKTRAVVGLFLAILVAGCDDSHLTDAILVTNNSAETLHFEITAVDGGTFPLARTAAPGETIRILDGSQLSDGAGLTRDRCTVGDIRALADDGRTLATWPAPVCATTTLTVR